MQPLNGAHLVCTYQLTRVTWDSTKEVHECWLVLQMDAGLEHTMNRMSTLVCPMEHWSGHIFNISGYMIGKCHSYCMYNCRHKFCNNGILRHSHRWKSGRPNQMNICIAILVWVTVIIRTPHTLITRLWLYINWCIPYFLWYNIFGCQMWSINRLGFCSIKADVLMLTTIYPHNIIYSNYVE